MPEPMTIAQLRVADFRSIGRSGQGEATVIPLQAFTILIGRNNTGKSNVLAAIRALFAAARSSLSDDDFRLSGEERSSEFSIEALVLNVGDYLPLLEEKHRKKVEACVEDDAVRIRRVVKREGLEPGKIEIWQPETETYGVPTGIDAAFRQFLPEVIYVEAFRDPTGEATGKSTAALGKMLKQLVAPVEAAIQDSLDRAFADAARLLNVVQTGGVERDERVGELRELEDRLRRFLKEVFMLADVRLEFEPPQVGELLEGVTLRLRDDTGWTVPGNQGQGFQRMLYFALLRALAESGRLEPDEVRRPFLLLFEEPEAFLHPALQREMGDTLGALAESNQVIIATHSPVLVAPSRISEVVHVRSEGQSVFTVPDARLTEDEEDRHVGKLMSLANSSEFMFADRVLVVEGPSDRYILEAVWSRRQELGLDPAHLAVIEAGSKDVVPRWCQNVRRFGIPAHGLVDLDYLLRGAGKLLGAHAGLSSFMQSFWSEAEAAGVQRDDGGSLRTADKPRAFELIEAKLGSERDRLVLELREQHSIYVLPRGEIEKCVGLSPGQKDQYLEAAARIRSGEDTAPDELVDVLRWVTQ